MPPLYLMEMNLKNMPEGKAPFPTYMMRWFPGQKACPLHQALVKYKSASV